MLNVLVHGTFELEQMAALSSSTGCRIAVVEATAEEREWVVPDRLVQTVNVLLTVFLPANLADMSRLQLVQIGSVGYAQLAGHDLPGKGIRACNARGVFDVPIGEWNVAMMINLIRDLRGMIRNQESGHWDASARFQQEINGLVVGLWGYGGIGRETARLCKALGMTVHVLSRAGVGSRENVYHVSGTGDPDGILPDRVFLKHQTFDFLSTLDFLVVAMPLTATTRGLIGQAELEALPARAFILNPARGPIIQEEALLHAIREGSIAGAALDTHYSYPMPSEHPLWAFPNVIMTPHISGSSLNRNYEARIWDVFSQNVERLIAGRPLLNELTAQVLAEA